jgi:TolB-like protein/DNA-binding winged helix-turn-helix (wHTH) protein
VGPDVGDREEAEGTAIADPVPLSFEGFTLDPTARTLVDAVGEEISLRRSEFELLLAFVNRPGRALTRDYLLEIVAGRQSEAFDRSIDVLVGRLRRKLEREPRQPRLILTVPGIGYRFAGKPHPVSLPAQPPQTLPQLPGASSEGAAADSHAICPGELDGAFEAVRNAATGKGANLQPVAARRLSIVVLPFINLTGDREQQYFADALIDDLTTDLSRIEDLLVISRNTAFTYRDKPADTRQIGRELGVRYVLEGGVRRLGSHIRINTQLIDAGTDTHLWAERFDRDVGDSFALQDEVTSRIAIALKAELVTAEAARPTAHPDALDYIFRARALLLQPRTHDNFAAAITLFERALALDPSSVEAQSRLANALAYRVINDMTTSRVADIARAETLVSEALVASPRSALAHFAKGHLLRAQRRPEEAIPEFETVIALDRNWLWAYANVSWCKLLIGSIDEVIPLVEKLLRLSPRDPEVSVWYYWIGRVHLLKSRTDEAIPWFEKARRANPAFAFIHAYLASAFALNGEAERATAELAEARRLSADARYSDIGHLKANQYFGVPSVRDLFEATYFAGLRKAGMPEE